MPYSSILLCPYSSKHISILIVFMQGSGCIFCTSQSTLLWEPQLHAGCCSPYCSHALASSGLPQGAGVLWWALEPGLHVMHCRDMQDPLPQGKKAQREEAVSGAHRGWPALPWLHPATLVPQNQRMASREAGERESEQRCGAGCAPGQRGAARGPKLAGSTEGCRGSGGADLYFDRTKLPHPIGHLRRLGEELTCSTAAGGQGQGTVSHGGPAPASSPPSPCLAPP